jgi:hypothetical protein
VRYVADGMRDRGKRGKDIATLQMGRMPPNSRYQLYRALRRFGLTTALAAPVLLPWNRLNRV